MYYCDIHIYIHTQTQLAHTVLHHPLLPHNLFLEDLKLLKSHTYNSRHQQHSSSLNIHQLSPTHLSASLPSCLIPLLFQLKPTSKLSQVRDLLLAHLILLQHTGSHHLLLSQYVHYVFHCLMCSPVSSSVK